MKKSLQFILMSSLFIANQVSSEPKVPSQSRIEQIKAWPSHVWQNIQKEKAVIVEGAKQNVQIVFLTGCMLRLLAKI